MRTINIMSKAALLNIVLISTLAASTLTVTAFSGDHSDDKHGHTEQAHDKHGHGEHGSDHHDEKEITINDEMTRDSGIEVTTASEGVITEHLTTYGKIVPDPGHVSHIGARFEGTVIEVKVNIGQAVKKGDLLAVVEANQSLSNYPIHAPFDGIITARHANPGELAQKQPLFTVADYSFMWVELKVFPQDMSKVRAGQKVLLVLNDQRINTNIDHVVPNDDDHPFILARASIDNPDNRLSAGMMAQGKIIINEQTVPIAVNQDAVQTLENRPVVFVKTETGFEAKDVSLGLKDDRFVEITEGLNAGDEYVIKNSYTLKADLLKSGAKHAH